MSPNAPQGSLQCARRAGPTHHLRRPFETDALITGAISAPMATALEVGATAVLPPAGSADVARAGGLAALVGVATASLARIGRLAPLTAFGSPRAGRRRYAPAMSLLDRISRDPAIVHGRPTVRGTRMRVADVLSLLAAGADESEILTDYPYLAAADIKACLAYAAAQADHAILSA